MENEENDDAIFGFVMLQDELFDANKFIADYECTYNGTIKVFEQDDELLGFKVEEELVIITLATYPVPQEDIQYAAQYAYNWKTAAQDLQSHKSHLTVTIFRAKERIKCYQIFTKVICSLLRSTNAIGVYKGNQLLLLHKKQYLSIAKEIGNGYLPIPLWIYFGLIVDENGSSGYTYGLKEFNKTEIEVIASTNNIDDVQGFLYSTVLYILENDVIFKHGQTIGATEEEKIPISLSDGVFVDGNSFKFGY